MAIAPYENQIFYSYYITYAVGGDCHRTNSKSHTLIPSFLTPHNTWRFCDAPPMP